MLRRPRPRRGDEFGRTYVDVRHPAGWRSTGTVPSPTTPASLNGPGKVVASLPLRRRRASARGGLAALLGALGLAGIRTGALPRPLTVAALAAAGVNALAQAVLAVPKAALVIPAGGFPTFVILGIAGFRLARGPKLAGMQQVLGHSRT